VGSARPQNENAAPNPIGHAAPDVELAEAQLALGRPELVGSEAVSEDELEELEIEEQDGGGRGRGGTPGGPGFDGEGPPSGGAGELAVPGAPVPERGALPGSRLIAFLQGSWRELQRVQWPDRRQVMQATAVVIGFVIVAGVFLGVADFLAGKLMNYILK
jgi:preprotein translocase SecE subunit